MEADARRNRTRGELKLLPASERARWPFWCDVRLGITWTMRYHFQNSSDRDAFEEAMRTDTRAIPVQVIGIGAEHTCICGEPCLSGRRACAQCLIDLEESS